MRHHSIRAFSLIELIVVLLIMGTVGSVVVACFMGGVRAYERARDFGREEVDAYLAFEVIERDLKNIVAVPESPFAGDAEFMQFPTAKFIPEVEGGGGLALVRYWEEPHAGLMSRSVAFGSVGAQTPESDMLLSGDVSMRLAYRAGGEAHNDATWAEAWSSSSNFPQQVRIQIAGGQLGESVFERIVLLPIGGE